MKYHEEYLAQTATPDRIGEHDEVLVGKHRIMHVQFIGKKKRQANPDAVFLWIGAVFTLLGVLGLWNVLR